MVSLRHLLALAASLSTTIACCYGTQGQIIDPLNGTAIAPGETFAFDYGERNGRYYTSVNYTVMLLTSPAGSTPEDSFLTQMLSGSGSATGYYYGHFGVDSVGNQFPTNPPPTTLTMPDFSQPPWNSGPQSDLVVYLGVLEEWSEGVTIGRHLSLTANWLVYNATRPVASPYLCPGGNATTPALGSCGCTFQNYCQVTTRDRGNYLPTPEPAVTSAAACRDACDSTPTCHSYTWWARDFTACYLYTGPGESLTPTNADWWWFSGSVDRTCKDQCDAAKANTTASTA